VKDDCRQKSELLVAMKHDHDFAVKRFEAAAAVQAKKCARLQRQCADVERKYKVNGVAVIQNKALKKDNAALITTVNALQTELASAQALKAAAERRWKSARSARQEQNKRYAELERDVGLALKEAVKEKKAKKALSGTMATLRRNADAVGERRAQLQQVIAAFGQAQLSVVRRLSSLVPPRDQRPPAEKELNRPLVVPQEQLGLSMEELQDIMFCFAQQPQEDDDEEDEGLIGVAQLLEELPAASGANMLWALNSLLDTRVDLERRLYLIKRTEMLNQLAAPSRDEQEQKERVVPALLLSPE